MWEVHGLVISGVVRLSQKVALKVDRSRESANVELSGGTRMLEETEPTQVPSG